MNDKENLQRNALARIVDVAKDANGPVNVAAANVAAFRGEIETVCAAIESPPVPAVLASFLQGFGSILDMFTPPDWPDSDQSNGEKLQGDWDRLAGDFWRAAHYFNVGGAAQEDVVLTNSSERANIVRRQPDAAKPI